ncbi:hypothetical protein ABL78_3795 [Leptomonas seymouri]|uniref:Uncharacterized protein n=1 Tax=Leptomonas seymouri TaxID=5684 RepID=A0A0N1IL49_LEPSE|nr:hypothetical protein ABL78_3795 [Leptomonas seymouri]|eukprot:KPI87142.1 hypothetical protein ABL78_3795 [Leptomonas seymouri]
MGFSTRLQNDIERKMQPIAPLVAVDTYPAPSVNAAYKRANGEAPFSSRTTEAMLPALLRPQFVALSEDDLRGLERRMYYQDRAAQRDSRIEERVARASARTRAAAEQREAQLRLRAARNAKVAGEVRVRKVEEEYRVMGMR